MADEDTPLPSAGPPTEHEAWLRQAAAIGVPRAFLLAGEVLSDRFEVGKLDRAGGMGAVYRATDLETQQPVAIKVVTSCELDSYERFTREALLLAELDHPCIVRYHAQGTSPRGYPFLAMEWLQGEDLAARLSRSKLSVADSLALLQRVAEGAAIAHARGIIHRDIKPSNIFLPDGDVRAAKLIDFGVARHFHEPTGLTHTGTVLGTVGYMSPEQAMASEAIDARTDVFALGCVLYECLTGRPAFSGVNPVAALTKVLYEEPPHAGELLPDLPASIDALLSRMLTKHSAQRLPDARAVLGALAESERGSPAVIVRLSASERAIATVVIGEARAGELGADDLAAIRAITQELGVEPVALRSGPLSLVLSGPAAATDLAQRAVRCALRLSQLRADFRFAVATGRTEELPLGAPTGAAIDRAAQLLAASGGPIFGVAIDDLTLSLLGSSFELHDRNGQWLVVAERQSLESARLFMGKPTPFMGRDKELALLTLTLRECLADSVTQAILVTGPPGQGKSRLRQELIAASVREHGLDKLRVVLLAADPAGANSSLLLIKRFLVEALRLVEGDGYELLHERIAEHCEPESVSRIAGFLGELLGTPCRELASAELRAARADPQIMSHWLRRAFGEWLAAYAASGTLLLALEDVHWADAASLAYLSDALRDMPAQRVLVLALARTEQPGLFAGTALQTIALGRLSPRAAERLVHAVLGPTQGATLARIIERADGNAFYLEELIRGVAQGDAESSPESVLALVQSRLQSLPPAARQIVRAASVFGEVCWRGGIGALLGAEVPEEELARLALLEVLTPSLHSRFSTELEYRFRHSLIREAAYGMLTERDRVVGHALAGQWLESMGERDALTLANHFDLGGEPARARPWLLRAGRSALSAGNSEIAEQCAERGVRCSATAEERGKFELIRLEALVQRAEWGPAIEAAEIAMQLLPTQSAGWLHANSGALLAATFLGSQSVVTKTVGAIIAAADRAASSKGYGNAIFMATQGLSYVNRLDLADSFVKRAQEVIARTPEPDPVFSVWFDCSQALIELRRGRIGVALERMTTACRTAEQVGSAMGAAVAHSNLVKVLSETGHLQRTLAAARTASAICKSAGLHVMQDHIEFCVAAASSDADSASAEIIALRAPLQRMLDKEDSVARSSAVRTLLAYHALQNGELDAAQQGAELALNETKFASGQADALGVLVLVELCHERHAAALALAERGLALTSTAANAHTAAVLYLTRARALHGLGRLSEACLAIAVARDRLLEAAATLKDPDLHDAFLKRPPNASTFRLAHGWLSDGGLERASEGATSVYG